MSYAPLYDERWIWFREIPVRRYRMTRRALVRTSLTGRVRPLRDGTASLHVDGTVTLEPGFEWDGLSGAPDTRRAMRAGAVHDVLYRLMREGALPQSVRADADRVFGEILQADAVHPADIAVMVAAARALGADAAAPEGPAEEMWAP